MLFSSPCQHCGESILSDNHAAADLFGYHIYEPKEPDMTTTDKFDLAKFLIEARALADTTRCYVTEHLWNTDTIPEGRPCQCANCSRATTLRAACVALERIDGLYHTSVDVINGYRIERDNLARENERLRTALQKISDFGKTPAADEPDSHLVIESIADYALREK